MAYRLSPPPLPLQFCRNGAFSPSNWCTEKKFAVYDIYVEWTAPLYATYVGIYVVDCQVRGRAGGWVVAGYA